MGVVNGLLGIRIVTPESIGRRKKEKEGERGREHTCESKKRRARGTFVIPRTVEGDSHLTRPVAPNALERKTVRLIFYLRCRTQKCWPRLPSSRNPDVGSPVHEIFAQWSHLAAFSSATTGLRESYENVARPSILHRGDNPRSAYRSLPP